MQCYKMVKNDDTILWVIGIIIAGALFFIFILPEVELFGVFTPDISQPEGTDSLVYSTYYDEAVDNYNFPCETGDFVQFRTNKLVYEPGGATVVPNVIAFTESCGNNLVVYGYSSKPVLGTPQTCASLGSTETLIMENLPGSTGWSRGSGNIGLWSTDDPDKIYLCEDKDDGSKTTSLWFRKYKRPTPDEYRVETSPESINPELEIICEGEASIKGEPKYACRDGNVVLQYCNSFLSDYTIQEVCDPLSPCRFFLNQQTPIGGGYSTVKCDSNYKPNKKLCVDATLYFTNSDGSVINYEVCGYQCINEACIDCEDGKKRCAQLTTTNTDIEICQYGEWVEWKDTPATCIGEEVCVNGECISEFFDGQMSCDGHQPQKYYGTTETWEDYGERCIGDCIQGSAIYAYCESLSITIELSTIEDEYAYGIDLEFEATVFMGENPYSSTVTATIETLEGGVLESISGIPDLNGVVLLKFTEVEASGEVVLKISAGDVEQSHPLFFTGISVNLEPTTYSYTQYNSENIKFLVHAEDANYKDIYPEVISNLHVITSLSYGTILNDTIDYLGSGVYEVSSEVEGIGKYYGKLGFTYQGIDYMSEQIEINVEHTIISVGTNLIPPTATLNTEETLTVSFASSIGKALDPDEITITISLPSGYEGEILYMSDLTKIGNGTYEFDYLFTQVEKYSFDIVANKEGVGTGNAKATVSVTGNGGGPGPAIGFENLELIFYAAIALIILFVIIGAGKRKGGTGI